MDIIRKSIIYESERLYMRGLSFEDIRGKYFHWFNDQEVTKFNSHGLFPNTVSKMESFINSLSEDSKIVWAVVVKKEEIHIGNISLQQIDWVNRKAEFAVIMGEKGYWKQGYATESSIILLNHGFNKLNLHRIYCGMAATNLGMQKLAQKLGMKDEGRERQSLYLNGEYVDVLKYGVLRNEFNRNC